MNTIRELVEELSKYNMEEKVFIYNWETGDKEQILVEEIDEKYEINKNSGIDFEGGEGKHIILKCRH